VAEALPIYNDCSALSDIVEWVKATGAEGIAMPAMSLVGVEAENRTKSGTTTLAAPPFLRDIGSAPRAKIYEVRPKGTLRALRNGSATGYLHQGRPEH